MYTYRFLLFVSMMYFVACAPEIPETVQSEELIPSSATLVMKINKPEQFISEYRNSELLNTFLGSEAIPWRQSLQTVLELDPPAGSLLVLRDSLMDPGEWLLLLPGLQVVTDTTLASGSEASSPLWDLPDSTNLHFAHFHNVPVLASSQRYLNRVLREPADRPEGIQKTLAASGPTAMATLLLAQGTQDPFNDIPIQKKSRNAGGWSSYDMLAGRNSLGFQRMETETDSTKVSANLLRSIPALPLQRAASMIPANADSWISYTLQEPGRFRDNQAILLKNENPNLLLLESVEQLSAVEVGNSQILILHTLNASVIEEELRPFKGEGTDFQGVLIYTLEETNLLHDTFVHLLPNLPTPRFYATLEDTFIFSASLEAMQGLISHKNRKDTFEATPEFEKLNPSLASESSVLLISKNPATSELIASSPVVTELSSALFKKLPDGYILGSQWNLEKSFSIGSYLFLDKDFLSRGNDGVEEVFTADLEAPAITRPQFLKNHRDGSMDIVVQDEKNTLYLFSNSGVLRWKKDLGSPVQGGIKQVDLFRNGRLQMAFTTSDKLMVLDRNGKEVSPFPKTFKGGNLNPLAVFDYEQNRNYRLLVTQGSKVYMFDGQGRTVSGFKLKDTGSPVISEPKHFRFGSRDYLVFQLESGELKILNRVGDRRISVKERFEFSANGVFGYRNGFAFTDRKGNLISIDTRGKIGRTALNLSPDHGMDASTKTLTLMDDNRFRVKANEATLELGVYTPPQLFYLYDIIYVAVTDLQSQQVHLFRSTAKELSGFPVEGNGLADIADIDNDRNPELVVPYRDNGIRVYRVRR